MTCDPVLPATRAAVFTAVCLGLSAGAHQAMSGAPIPGWALVLGGAGVFVLARLGAGRERSLAAIAVLMGSLQVALHLLFAYAQTAAAAASMPGMTMPQGVSMPGTPAMPNMPGMPATGSELTSWMIVVHASAALICAWWLRRGEAAVHGVLRGVTDRLRVRLRPPAIVFVVVVRTAPILRARRNWPTVALLRNQWLLRGTRALRGPPSAHSFA